MLYKILSQQPHNISIEEAKRQCSIMPEFTLDDELITHLVDASFEVAQKYTRKALVTSVASAYSEYREIKLAYGNIESIDKVAIDGEVVTDGFTFNEFSNTVYIDSSVVFSNVNVVYTAGYKAIPKQVLQGIYLMVNTLYLNRENFSVGEGGVSDIPVNSMYLWDTIREHQI